MKNFKLSNCLLKKCWHKVSTFKRYCSSQSRETWKSVVGLEIHAQLNSKTKLFSGSPNRFGGVVNNDVSLFDAAIPGTLPVLNRRCVELGIVTALALSCKINEVSMFDRKHYFYADLPAGYQITQQRAPLANNGIINFQVYTPGIHKKPYKKYSKIKQIQLEQDSGKSLHDSELKQSLVDLNRAGVPLIELVFEPDLEDGEEAAALVKELVLIVQRLGVCSGRMEEGALRVDANVSVHRPEDPLGTRTEIKNIGSIRGVAGAIRYEVGRQLEVLKNGGCIVNETRAWDSVARCTVAMRDKEQVQDYRYMPEPNLPPLRVNLTTENDTPDVISVPHLHATLPELPEQTRQKLIQKYELKPTSVIQLVNEPILLQYFSNVVLNSNRDPNKVVNFLLNDLVTMLNKNKIHLEDCPLKDLQIIEILDLLAQKKIDLEGSRQLLDELLVKPDAELVKIMEQQHLLLVTDEEEIIRRCIKVIENNPKLVKKYKDGEVKVFKALLGILAKDTRPKLDMSIVSKKLEDLLKR